MCHHLLILGFICLVFFATFVLLKAFEVNQFSKNSLALLCSIAAIVTLITCALINKTRASTAQTGPLDFESLLSLRTLSLAGYGRLTARLTTTADDDWCL